MQGEEEFPWMPRTRSNASQSLPRLNLTTIPTLSIFASYHPFFASCFTSKFLLRRICCSQRLTRKPKPSASTKEKPIALTLSPPCLSSRKSHPTQRRATAAPPQPPPAPSTRSPPATLHQPRPPPNKATTSPMRSLAQAAVSSQ